MGKRYHLPGDETRSRESKKSKKKCQRSSSSSSMELLASALRQNFATFKHHSTFGRESKGGSWDYYNISGTSKKPSRDTDRTVYQNIVHESNKLKELKGSFSTQLKSVQHVLINPENISEEEFLQMFNDITEKLMELYKELEVEYMSIDQNKHIDPESRKESSDLLHFALTLVDKICSSVNDKTHKIHSSTHISEGATVAGPFAKLSPDGDGRNKELSKSAVKMSELIKNIEGILGNFTSYVSADHNRRGFKKRCSKRVGKSSSKKFTSGTSTNEKSSSPQRARSRKKQKKKGWRKQSPSLSPSSSSSRDSSSSSLSSSSDTTTSSLSDYDHRHSQKYRRSKNKKEKKKWKKQQKNDKKFYKSLPEPWNKTPHERSNNKPDVY